MALSSSFSLKPFWLCSQEGVFSFNFPHHHLLMVLKLQTKVVALDEIHVGTHQVKQHLARGFLL